jgi:hypothetical protein
MPSKARENIKKIVHPKSQALLAMLNDVMASACLPREKGAACVLGMSAARVRDTSKAGQGREKEKKGR